ncbi:class I SAM-dependent methyltransferase [Shewanella algae]|uniref:class I SAM-dependent methyltransferase n=1 Tax=Shewanella algae TaxID=38313 RepID=UPI001AACE8EC|nr:class I SAM-dependent methyltransferase [Shewanella algae]MBO2579411.1 methyltransferase domain-containing protein [Shewanella algae]MBO2684864.1 methyltransferase domain-containing protein [Shewanella algae]BCV64093.1 type 12 methyltransferase [Shewanella algae]
MNTAELITTFERHTEITPKLRVLDLACGSGRNGHWFAKQGAEVTFIDRNPESFDDLWRQFPHCQFIEWDLEQGDKPELQPFDVVLVFNYLHRPSLPWIAKQLKLGGLLFYETFTQEQAKFGRPSNPDFLLNQSELQHRFAKFETLHYFEGHMPGGETGMLQAKAQLIARAVR